MEVHEKSEVIWRSFVDVRGREEVLLVGAIFFEYGYGDREERKIDDRSEIHIKAGCVAVR
jgi:hypothetical protein